VVALALGLGIVLSGTAAPLAQTAVPRGHQSGEALFNGIFMGTGPVAARLPEVWQGPEALVFREVQRLGRAQQVRREVAAGIRAEEPGFFEWFGAEIQSGDHVRVEFALMRTVEVLERVAHRRYGVDVRNPGAPSATCFWVAVPVAVVYFAVAVHTVAAVLIATYAEVLLLSIEDPRSGGVSSSLRKDWLVNLVATRFAV
jgi:SdpC family antimicrobial peptide